MKRTLRVLAVMMAGCAAATTAQNRYDRLELALRNPACQPSDQTTCGADMQSVQAALASPTTLWEFITSPTAGYFERRVAASKAGRMIPADWIPRLLAAERELETEGNLHYFGIQTNPMSARGPWQEKTPRDRIGGQPERNILGHAFLVPEAWIDYPLTDEELKRSPWPTQAARALGDLSDAIIQDGDPGAIDSVALTLPCTDEESADRLVSLTTGVALWQRYASPAVFGTWLNILRNPNTQRATFSIVISLEHLADIDSSMAEVLGLESLKKGDNTAIRSTRYFARGPYTLILAASRFVLSADYRTGHDAQDRADDANTLRYAALQDPFAPGPNHLVADEATYQRVVDSFAEWFTQQESTLQRNADMERGLIERAYEQMAEARVCRAPV